MSDLSYATLWDHFEELRKRLLFAIAVVVLGMGVAALFYEPLFAAITAPLSGGRLVILKPTEGIVIAMKVCFWVGLVATSPLWMLQLSLFIIPALHGGERRLLLPLGAALLLFFLLGSYFCYAVTLPLANHYLLLFNSSMGENLWSLESYIDYSFLLLLGNGLAFEVAVLLLFAVHVGLFSADALVGKRRLYILFAFIFSAIVTPPDAITQIALALPLTLLYELAILYAKFRARSWPIVPSK